MAPDAIVEETRQIRDRLAKAQAYDVRKNRSRVAAGRDQERAEAGDTPSEEAPAKACEVANASA